VTKTQPYIHKKSPNLLKQKAGLVSYLNYSLRRPWAQSASQRLFESKAGCIYRDKVTLKVQLRDRRGFVLYHRLTSDSASTTDSDNSSNKNQTFHTDFLSQRTHLILMPNSSSICLARLHASFSAISPCLRWAIPPFRTLLLESTRMICHISAFPPEFLQDYRREVR